MKKIQRTSYLDRLVKFKEVPDIKVITGIRRSGKSELLNDLIGYLKVHEPKSNLIYISFQELEYHDILEYHKLHEYVMSRYVEGKKNYLFIDEVQDCPKFELAINSLHAKGIFSIYITGSNAFLLSSDLATLFTGRTCRIEVYPFSFKEFLQYFNLPVDSGFDEYVRRGGMPGSYIYDRDDEDGIRNYMVDVFDTVLLRDLITRNKIKNGTSLKNIADFLMDNVGNLTSSSNINNFLNSQKIESSHNTIANYLDMLCEAFIFYKVKRYDVKGKLYLSSNDKYYLSDHAFRVALHGSRNLDYGRIYENIVAIELLRRGYDIYVGKLYEKEIDFVALKGNEKLYIQVSANIDDPSTLEREVANLLAIRDAYPKMVIARTHHEVYDIEGVKIFDIAKWLNND